jgi:hypothetical protein
MSSRRSTRISRIRTLASLVALAVLAAPGAALASWWHGHHHYRPHRGGWDIDILSSAPDQVSGGDALVRVEFPGRKVKKNAVLLLNGVDVTDMLTPDDGDLVGVVTGFGEGTNYLDLKVSSHARSRVARLVVVNHPQSGPIFSGPQQQPFVCTTARVGLGQPIIDNQDSFGIPVAQEDASGNYPRDGRGYPTAAATIIGWSKNCAGNRRVEYQYRRTTGGFAPLPGGPTGPLPADIATTTTLDGDVVPYIVRWERGTINRFIYSVAMLAPVTETDPNQPDDSLWNGRLVLSFEGGVAIGRTQGTIGGGAQLQDITLRLGYAVLASSGTRMNTHYNLQLSGETALMLKEHFIEDHGVPLYTVSVGGSGGAIQQYAYGHNHPGLIDAAIPQYSYSDMITQTIHVGDCELLEHYFDKTDLTNAKWKDVLNRRAIQGLNASVSPTISASEAGTWNGLYSIYSLLGLNRPTPIPPAATTPPPLTECRRAWFGLTPLVLNPTFTNVQDIDKLAQGVAGVDWTHSGDLVNVYGTDADGYGRSPWDNVGVQYGLQALRDGVITPAEFLDLNAKVGSWKEPSQMVTEGFPFLGGFNPANFDPWSSRNMNLSPDGGVTPAPRRTGSLEAMNAAYDVGIRFDGDLDIPVIDWRHYLEEQLDMHHSHQSFATRARMARRHDADNQVIWFTDARPGVAFDQTPEAFEVIDEWMENIRLHPWQGIAGNKPARAVDRCFTTAGTEIAAGDDVWDGVLDDDPAGACTQLFPLYSSSRRVAGGPYEGGIFKCGLKSVDESIADGDYGAWAPSVAERDRLMQIFPEGVCDWSEPDQGRPDHGWPW